MDEQPPLPQRVKTLEDTVRTLADQLMMSHANFMALTEILVLLLETGTGPDRRAFDRIVNRAAATFQALSDGLASQAAHDSAGDVQEGGIDSPKMVLSRYYLQARQRVEAFRDRFDQRRHSESDQPR